MWGFFFTVSTNSDAGNFSPASDDISFSTEDSNRLRFLPSIDFSKITITSAVSNFFICPPLIRWVYIVLSWWLIKKQSVLKWSKHVCCEILNKHQVCYTSRQWWPIGRRWPLSILRSKIKSQTTGTNRLSIVHSVS